MKEEIKEALEKSIIHWENVRDGKEETNGRDNCALCKIIDKMNNRQSCNKCPVKEKIGFGGCSDTPYIEWCSHFMTDHPLYHGPKRVICLECKVLAQKEIDFLKSLREPEEIERFYCRGDIIKFNWREFLAKSDRIMHALLVQSTAGITATLLNYSREELGTRFHRTVNVRNSIKITQEELKEIIGDYPILGVIHHNQAVELFRNSIRGYYEEKTEW